MKKILIILCGFVVVTFTVIAGIVVSLDVNQYKPEIVKLIKDKTGREFSINGELHLAPSLLPTIAVSDVTFGNAQWGSEPDMLSVRRFEAEVSLLPLLRKNIQVNRLILLEPNILLETDKQGQGNWIFAEPGKVADLEEATDTDNSPSGTPGLNINEVVIENANLTYVDGQKGKTTKLHIEEISARSSSFSDPLNLKVRAALNESPISVDAELGSLNDLTSNQSWPVKLSALVDKASASIDGQIDQPMQGKGMNLNVAFNIDSLSHLNRVAGSELPQAGPIKVGGKLTDTDNGYSVSGLVATLLKFEIKGDVSVSMAGDRPSLVANLSADTLDVSPFQPDEKAKPKQKKTRVFSPDTLPLAGLNSADLDLKMQVNKFITKDATLSDVNLSLSLKNGKLKLQPFTANVAGGTLQIATTLDASSGKTATLNQVLTVRQLELGQLPNFRKNQALSGGKTDVDIKLSGSGQSVAAIAGNLNGEILLNTGAGKMANQSVDMAGADVVFSALDKINPMSEKEAHTSLECAVLNFIVKDGMATTDRGIAFRTERINISGSGTIDLKNELLNLAVKPRAREGLGINLGTLVDAVQITGPLSDPSIGVGAKGALTAGISAGAAVATGGLSLLAQGLFSKTTGKGNPCDIALGKVAKPEPVEEAPASEKSAVETATDTAADAVKDVTEGAGKLLKGLFD